MRLFQKNDSVVGLDSQFVYLVEIYKCWKRGTCFSGEHWIKSAHELKVPSKKVKRNKVWIQSYVTLKYAPELFLRNHGYKEI